MTVGQKNTFAGKLKQSVIRNVVNVPIVVAENILKWNIRVCGGNVVRVTLNISGKNY